MNLDDSTLDRFARSRLDLWTRRDLRRKLRETERQDHAGVIDDGATLVSFACNDYLGLSRDPALIAASVEATRRHGTGAGASRLVTGNHPLYRSLEAKLATLKGTDDAVVFGSGYLASVGVLTALATAPDLILLDELAHSCLYAGARLSGATVLTFAHNDCSALTALLTGERARHRHCLIVTEGVFSMDGDRAPLAAMAALARQHDAWLVTDDAHALGVIGQGRGSAHAHAQVHEEAQQEAAVLLDSHVQEQARTPVPVHVQMGTLSKAAGAYGGYACTSGPVADLLRNRARSFVYSTGLPPGTVAAASAALDIIASDPQRVATPLQHARAFTDLVGLPRAASAIVSLPMGTPRRALEASRILREHGFLVIAIRPPTVPAGTARLRVTFSAAHSPQQVRELAAAVQTVQGQLS